jgi:PAS domain S-box-containing protein
MDGAYDCGEDGPSRAGEPEVVRARFDALGLIVASYEGRDHRLVAANAAFRAFSGRSEVVGRPLRELLPEFEGQQVIAMADRVYATGEPQTGREWRIRVERDHGSVEYFLDFVLEPYRGPDGAVVGVTEHAIDVTDQVVRQRAEQDRTAAGERRYEQARDVIATLQRALLPPGLPVVPGLQIGASYLLADEDTAAGGDWFDAVPLPDGRIGLVVGDVVGHGVAASAVMGQLRAVLAERLAAGAGLTDALGAVDLMAARVSGARAATVCVVLLDPAGGTVSYCTAGHPPPLLVPGAGDARFLAATGAGPLGVGSAFVPAVVGQDHLDVDDVLVLYSDGIVERPARTWESSTAELTRVAEDAAAGRIPWSTDVPVVERVCSQALELLIRATGHIDDVTLLAAQRTTPVPDVALSLAAEPTALHATRTALRGWLDAVGVAEEAQLAIQHAVGEVVTNAVEHAYGPGPAPPHAQVDVHGVLTPAGVVQVEVSDRGRWLERPDGDERQGRGNGLAVARELVDAFDVDTGGNGTTVTVGHHVSRQPRLLTADEVVGGTGAAPGPPDRAERLRVVDQPSADGGRVRLDGPVDAVSAPRLHAELQRRTRGGSRPLTVDLTGVTHLASAGVAVLHRFTRDGALRLFAPPASPAGQIMTLVALPHLTDDPGASAGASG